MTGMAMGMGLGEGGGGPSFDPVSLTTWSGLWRADSIAGADGSQVASWMSRAADAQAVVQAVGGNQPTKVASNPSFNGQPTVRFAGAQFMALASMNFGTAGSDCFVWTVCRLTTGGAVSLVINLSGAGAYNFQARYSGANVMSVLGSSGGETDWSAASLNATIAAATYCDGTAGAGHSQNISLGNATKIVTGGLTTIQSPTTMALTVGAFTGGSFPLIGDIAEFGIMPQEPGVNTRARLEAYAQQRYGAG